MNQADPDIIASRAKAPLFYHAPAPSIVTPKQYQHAGVEYGIARANRLYGDEPGLGKTAECILTDNAIDARERTLCIVPASLRLNWEREIWMWSTRENVSTYPILKASDGVSDQADFVIISYDLLRNPAIHEAIMALRWGHLIMDEAHALKDPKGNARTKAILGWHDKGTDVPGITDVCGSYTMASGTILPNQPSECYNAIRLLDWSAIDHISLSTFMEAYYGMGWGMATGMHKVTRADGMVIQKFGAYRAQVRNQPKNLDDLQHRLRKKVMVRRLKAHVLDELPPKQWHPFPLALTPALRKAMKHPGWLEAERLYDLNPAAFDHGVPIDGAVSTARRELGEAKAPAVADYCDELLREVDCIMVGAWHHTVLDYLRERFKKYNVVYMDGSTSAKKKQAAVDQFQERPDVRVILGQVRPLGEGWTLHRAQDGVLAEFDWTPGKNDQFIDRLHRIGQRGHVLGHIPIVPGTLDERILATAVGKDQNIHLALDYQS